MSWSIVMIKQPWPCFPQFSSFLPHWAHQTSQDVFVDVLINSLALWQEFCLNNSMDIKNSYQHHLGFELEHPRLFGSWWQCSLSFKNLPFGEWIVLEDPCLIPNNNSFQQVGFSFELPKNVWPPCTSFCPSFSNLGTISAQIFLIPSQIFRNDPPYPFTIHNQLMCYHSNSKTAIAPHLLSHTLNIFICLNLLCHSKRRVLDIVSSP